MAILKIARLGHPVLVRKADPVTLGELATPEVQRLIDDMIETMWDAPGVGLAAPQVHQSLRLFVMDPGKGGERDEPSGLRVLVNPVLTFPSDERIRLWEGCLSIPGIRGQTERFAEVEAKFLDREGLSQQASFRGLPAVVVQHETDHLDGVFFLHRMPDLARLAFEDELGRHDGVEVPHDGDAPAEGDTPDEIGAPDEGDAPHESDAQDESAETDVAGEADEGAHSRSRELT